MLIFSRRFAISAAALATLAAPRLSAQATATERAALDDLGPSYAMRLDLHRGWYRGRPILYYDIGPEPPTAAPVYLLAAGFDGEGRPRLLPGQRPLFGALPGLPGYSGIFEVTVVVVGPRVPPNVITSARAALGLVLRGEAGLVPTGAYANWPIVPEGSTLAGDPVGRTAQAGWFEGHAVSYFDFGRTPLEPAPIYNLTASLAGGDLVRFEGQANVVGVAPGSGRGYADLWDVHWVQVQPGYVADQVRDLDTLLAQVAAGRMVDRRVGQTRNCPVVIVDGRPAARDQVIP